MSTTTPPVDTSDAAPPGIPDAPNETLGDYTRRWWAGVRAGELGSLPIIVGLILIVIIFQSQNSQFLTAGNFVNLIVQMAAITIIGMGIVFVLLLGEIDLSVGFVSGVAGVTTALLMIPDGSNEFGAGPAIAVALLAGLAIGTLHGLLITKIGMVRVCSSARSRVHTSKPSKAPGSMRSSSRMSNRSLWASSTASAPVRTSTTWWPAAVTSVPIMCLMAS